MSGTHPRARPPCSSVKHNPAALLSSSSLIYGAGSTAKATDGPENGSVQVGQQGKQRLTAGPGPAAGVYSTHFWTGPGEERRCCSQIRHWNAEWLPCTLPPEQKESPFYHMATLLQLHWKYTVQSLGTKRLS